MAENNENEKMMAISYRIDQRVDVVSMHREMKDEIIELAEESLTGMALEIVQDVLSDKDYDLTELTGYDDRETKYLEEFMEDNGDYYGSFGSSAKLEDWEYMDGDGEWIWLTANYYEKVSYDAVLKELSDWGEPEEFEEDWLDYDLDGEGRMTIGGDDEDIKKLITELSGNPKTMEKFYKLNDLGIEIGAITRIKPFTSDRVENRICLRKLRTGEHKHLGKYKEAFISCVHTAIAVTSLEDLPEDQEFYIKSSESRKIDLDFDQHFFALNSFVQAISEFGLSTLMRESFNYSNLNFGFNNAMHSQFTRALLELDTVLAKELRESFMFDVLNSNPYEIGKKWLIDRHRIISSRFKIKAFRIISHCEFEIYESFIQLNKAFEKYSNLSDEEKNSMKEIEVNSLVNEFVGYELYDIPKKRDLSVLLEENELGEIFDEI